MRRDPDCVVCRIASGKAPSHQGYQDDAVLAFLDIAPLEEGNTLGVRRSASAELPVAAW